jgi:hypothetical protein
LLEVLHPRQVSQSAGWGSFSAGGAWVRWGTFSVYGVKLGRQPVVARGGQGGGQGIEAVVLAGVASEAREHPHPCRKLRRHVHYGLTGRRQPHRQMPTEAPGVLHRLGRRSGNRFAQRSRALKPVRSCGKLARSRSSPVASSTTATAPRRLVRIDPDEHLHERIPPFRSEFCHLRARRTFRLWVLFSYLF